MVAAYLTENNLSAIETGPDLMKDVCPDSTDGWVDTSTNWPVLGEKTTTTAESSAVRIASIPHQVPTEQMWTTDEGLNWGKGTTGEPTDEHERTETFEAMGLDDNILHGIYSYGFEKPSPIQQLAIKPLAQGQDVIAQAQAGTGKTAAFTLGMLQRIDPSQARTQAIVLVPTRVLADMHLGCIQALGEHRKVNAIRCIGGTSQREDQRKVAAGAHVVIGTPGRVKGLVEMGCLRMENIKVMVMDEADELLRDGENGFQDQVKDIVRYVPEDCQMGIFSATFSPQVLEAVKRFMRDPLRILVKPEEITMRHIKQFFIALHEPWKLDTLMDLYDTISVTQSIIFVNTITKLEYLKAEMTERDFAVSCYHAEMDMQERNEVIKNYKRGLSRVLIATDILARGIDIETVSLVINYDIPYDKEKYIHRIGRSGRASKKGVAINFVTERDVRALQAIEDFFKVDIEELPISGDLAKLI